MVDKVAVLQRELLKRTNLPPVLDYCFLQQRNFIEDKAHFKCCFTTRRAGKSTAIGVYIVKSALENPGCNILYLGLSKETASKTLRKDILNPILRRFNLQVNETEKKITFSNGSILYIQGVNASDKELAKVLGQKYMLAFLDEAQSYTIDTKNLIYQSLAATIQDMQGTIVMTGTPTDNLNTFFYDVTKQEGERAPGWKVHEWNTFHNIIKQQDGLSQAEKSKMQIEEFKETLPNVEDTDWFQQQYLGKWIIQNSLKVYKFNDDRNLIHEKLLLTKILNDPNWFFVLGVDFGATDASALVVIAYHRHEPTVYTLHAEKHTDWSITDVANRIKDLNAIYHFSNMVGDSAAKQSIIEIARHHGLPLKPTIKSGTKRESVAIINADFITGNIKIDPIECKGLIQELNKLIWDPRQVAEGRYRELASLENHECDAFNYAYHMSRHYRARPAPPPLSLEKAEDTLEMLKRAGLLKKPQEEIGKSVFDGEAISDQQVIDDFRKKIGKKPWK